MPRVAIVDLSEDELASLESARNLKGILYMRKVNLQNNFKRTNFGCVEESLGYGYKTARIYCSLQFTWVGGALARH